MAFRFHISQFFVLVVALLTWNIGLYAQEEVGPIEGWKNFSLYSEKQGTTSFDSSFIYLPDTLQLPVFDDFSSDHFQEYTTDFNAPGVTSETYYYVLDSLTLVPEAVNFALTSQQTFKRVFDLSTSTYSDSLFEPKGFKIADFSSYPPVYEDKNLYPPYYVYDTLGLVGDESDTIWMQFPDMKQDSAIQFFYSLVDANAYWLDREAYRNNTFAINPRSYGVVTLDGLNEDGFPYAIGSNYTNYADKLTSKPIDLSLNSLSDSIYLGFLYQPEGYGDIPESSDSLIVQFYCKNSNAWKTVWSIPGSASHEFKAVNIPVDSVAYFTDAFQFRFKNYGGLSGSLDHFHIDYVHLRAFSGAQDTIFKDFAITYPTGSLLKTFSSVPWDHYKANPSGKMTDSLFVSVHNGSLTTENNQNGSISVSYNGVPEATFVLNGQLLSGGQINYSARTTYLTYHDLTGGYNFDPTKPGDTQLFDVREVVSSQFPNYSQNDTSYYQQVFSNYYSYDDGSAEAAYGPVGVQARLAIRYEAYQPDSLIGVQINFVPSVVDVSSKLFLLTVWDDNNGKPGNVLYEDDAFFPRQPIYGNDRDVFQNYYFLDTAKVAVGNVFYVGWRQFDSQRLNVGLDRNIDRSANTFFSVTNGATWINSTFSGSVMIRPIVSTSLDAVLGTVSENLDEIYVYPNPVSETFQIIGLTDIEGVLINAIGQVVQRVSTNQINMIDLPAGIYYLKLEGISKVEKIVKTDVR